MFKNPATTNIRTLCPILSAEHAALVAELRSNLSEVAESERLVLFPSPAFKAPLQSSRVDGFAYIASNAPNTAVTHERSRLDSERDKSSQLLQILWFRICSRHGNVKAVSPAGAESSDERIKGSLYPSVALLQHSARILGYCFVPVVHVSTVVVARLKSGADLMLPGVISISKPPSGLAHKDDTLCRPGDDVGDVLRAMPEDTVVAVAEVGTGAWPLFVGVWVATSTQGNETVADRSNEKSHPGGVKKGVAVKILQWEGDGVHTWPRRGTHG